MTLPTTLDDGAISASLRRYAAAARGAFAGNTERALRADVVIFSRWCAEQGHQALPGSPETVAAFVDAMAVRRAPASIGRYVSSIAILHRAAEQANPSDSQIFKLALKRMHRERGRAQQQAAPLKDELVRQMLRARGNKRSDLRNRAILVTAYTTSMRCSELVALEYADLTVEADGFGDNRHPAIED
jgi:site-specific recombinase XerD